MKAEPDKLLKKRPAPIERGVKLKGELKTARVPVKFDPTPREKQLRKPKWIRAKFPGSPEVVALKKVLRSNNLHTVCEEASCPNLGECFAHGTATFMIMGDICTRRCPFCDVGHGRPNPLDTQEPHNLAKTIAEMSLRYVVITSVDRDDLRDGGADHFVKCIQAVRTQAPEVKIEVLTPDFRGRTERALDIFNQAPPDVFNHNLETVPRLYLRARPGSDYQVSLDLLKDFKAMHPDVATKSGIMLGLGEEKSEVIQVLKDLRSHNVEMLTVGQYLQPSAHHLPVEKYWTPEEFDEIGSIGEELGFANVASGPMVRSSYHADLQASQLVGR
ncbi:MAG: lipoic acid synthetase [Parasphingorhabdus sp.]|jgi:lipoic acid synthetase